MSIKKPYVRAEITRIRSPYETFISVKIPIKQKSPHAKKYVKVTNIFDERDYVKLNNKHVGDIINIYLHTGYEVSIYEKSQNNLRVPYCPKIIRRRSELIGLVKHIDRQENILIVDVGIPLGVKFLKNSEIIDKIKINSLVKFVRRYMRGEIID